MAQPLSGDEFQRMQAQLLELRTQNYQLADEVRKQNSEVSSLRLRCTNIEKDLAKAQKAVTKSKKAQEVDALLSENEMLQAKLHSQEDDFRLQNTTLMQELSKLCSQIEELEGENKRLSGAPLEAGLTPAAQPTATGGSGELLRLQAENTALQRNLTALQERLELEVAARDGGREGGAPGGGGAFPPPEASARDEGERGAPGPSRPSPETAEQLQSKCAKLEQKLKEFNEMGLRWEMEREEKRLLKEQLQSLETSKQSELNKLQEEASKVSEKLKRKQESFLHLQAEKEALYNDSRTKITEIQQKKEEELKSLSARNQRLQTELQVANQNLSDLKEQVHKMESEHNTMAQTLREQVVCQGLEFQEQMDSMLSENDALRTGLAALEQIQTAKTQEMTQLQEQVSLLSQGLRQRQGELEERSAQRDDLLAQLQGASEAKDLLLEQSQLLKNELERLREELEETAKLAEKRKAMLDELAIERQQDAARHQEALSSLRLKHDRDVLSVRGRYERELRELHDGKARGEEALREQLRDEKARNRDLENLQVKMRELRGELEEAQADKDSLQGQLQGVQELMESAQREHEERTRELEREHALELQAEQGETQSVREELCLAVSQREERGETIGRLQQEIKDTVDGQRILEKKGSSALKDLKRQLQLERRRADKLQERLQDFLTNTRTRSGLDDFVLGDIGSPGRNQTGDSSSISSFSLRDTIKDATGSKSTTGSPQSQRPADLSDDEVSDLFQRLAEVQQEKWMLEEQVKHLEVSCSSMADDLCRKSAIIETYVMDSRIDVTAGQSAVDREREKERAGSFGSVLRDLVKPGDENVREMNKKLQNMLEEQLTKNMHLQKDLEVLSQELVRLSKEDVTSKRT